MNAFSRDYVSQLAPVKKSPPAKTPPNPFDGNDARARMACVRTASLPATPKGGPNRPSNM